MNCHAITYRIYKHLKTVLFLTHSVYIQYASYNKMNDVTQTD